jgi:hypothetical protein
MDVYIIILDHTYQCCVDQPHSIKSTVCIASKSWRLYHINSFTFHQWCVHHTQSWIPTGLDKWSECHTNFNDSCTKPIHLNQRLVLWPNPISGLHCTCICITLLITYSCTSMMCIISYSFMFNNNLGIIFTHRYH